MKKLISLFLLALYALPFSFVKSQTLGIDKLTTFGNESWEVLSDIVFDSNGNYYITGSFSGDFTLNTSNSVNLSSNGKRDIFLVSFNSENNINWAKNIGGDFDDHAHSLACDNEDNLYLAGTYRKEFKIGSINIAEPGFTNNFLAKFNAGGTVQWAKSLNGNPAAQKAIVQTDTEGNIWIAGSYKKKLMLDASTEIEALAKTDIFFAKYNSSGSLISYKTLGGNGYDQLSSFVIDVEDNLYLAGSFENELFIVSPTVNSSGKSDAFLAKFNSNGEIQWLQHGGGNYDDKIKSITLDQNGFVYVAGEYKNTANFATETFSSNKSNDVFIIKYDAVTGAQLWAKQLNENSQNYASGIIAVGNNKLYLSGTFRGNIEIGDSSIVSKGKSKDIFIGRLFSTDGTFELLERAGGLKEDALYLKNAGTEAGIFVTGFFNKDLNLLTKEINNKNSKDLYFAQLIDCDIMPQIDLGPDSNYCSSSEIIANDGFESYIWSDGSTSANRAVSENGIYSLTVTDKFGCVSTDEIDITILPLPVVDLGEDADYCEGETVTLDAGANFASYLWNNNSSLRQFSVIESGNYSVEITDIEGCINTDEIQITINPLPVVDLGSDIVALPTDNITLSTAGIFVSYLWDNGETTATITLAMSQFSRARYVNLTVTDANNCSGYDEVRVRQGDPPAATIANNNLSEGNLKTNTENSEELLEEEKFTEYQVFPNPTNGRFFVQISKPELVKQLDIFNSRGMLIKTFKYIESNMLDVDISRYSKGLYLINITEEKTSKQFKIIYK